MRLTRILPIILFLTACAPAAPVAPSATAIPPTETATSTMEPTATLIRMIPSPTSTLKTTATEPPTLSPTNESFSDITPCKSVLEARSNKCSVSHHDIVSGRILRMAKATSEPFADSVKASNFSIDNAGNGFYHIYSHIDHKSPHIKIILVFNYSVNDQKYFLIIEKIRNVDGTDGYLQILVDNPKIVDKAFSVVLQQKVVLPAFIGQVSDGIPDSYENMTSMEDVNIKYDEYIQNLLRDWVESGVVPEELSIHVLDQHYISTAFVW